MTQPFQLLTTLKGRLSSIGSHRRTIRTVIAVVALSNFVIWWTPAGAIEAQKYAVDHISRSFEVSVTNPANHRDFPAVLSVQSAQLTTINPDGSGVVAPEGKIYLVLQASSGPVQLSSANPNSGNFFSNMTPLPAAALRYVATSGRSYAVTRVNPINQTYNGNADDDGLFDATYYFTVPLLNRSGTIVISPFRTTGVEYESFVGVSTTQLNIGGPTSFALTFPRNLTEVSGTRTSNTRTSNPASASGNGTTFASMLNFLSTVFVMLLVGILIVRRRRKKKATA
jgi:hypothetical protein